MKKIFEINLGRGHTLKVSAGMVRRKPVLKVVSSVPVELVAPALPSPSKRKGSPNTPAPLYSVRVIPKKGKPYLLKLNGRTAWTRPTALKHLSLWSKGKPEGSSVTLDPA